MKIAFFEIVHTFGGARISTVELAKRLSLKHEVYIIDLYGTCKPFIEACKNSDVNLKIVNKRDKTFTIHHRNPFIQIKNLFLFIKEYTLLRKKIGQILRDEKIECVVVNNTKALSYLIGKSSSIKTVFFARGWFIQSQINTRDRFMLKRYVDKFLCVSEATRHAIYCSGIANLEDLFVVPNAISSAEVDNINPVAISNVAEVNILFSGGFLPSKGAHVAIEVARMLKIKGISFKLFLTGIIYTTTSSRNYYERILNLVKSYELSDYVEVIVNHSNVIEYFKVCDILIHPSDTEGLPRVVMEAMKLKLAVIANPVGGVTDFILNGFTGFLVRKNNVNDYVSRIIELNNDVDKKEKIVNRAYDLITECYTPDIQVKCFVDSLN